MLAFAPAASAVTKRRRVKARVQVVRDNRRRRVADMLEAVLMGERVSAWTQDMFELFYEAQRNVGVEDLEAAYALLLMCEEWSDLPCL